MKGKRRIRWRSALRRTSVLVRGVAAGHGEGVEATAGTSSSVAAGQGQGKGKQWRRGSYV